MNERMIIDPNPVAQIASFPRRIGKVYGDAHNADRRDRAQAKRDRKATQKATNARRTKIGQGVYVPILVEAAAP